MHGRPTVAQVLSAVQTAARLALRNGTIIFNVGHGASDDGGNRSVGMVDLAPHGCFRIRQNMVFYGVDPDGAGGRTSQQESNRRFIQNYGDSRDPSLRSVAAAARESEEFRAKYDRIGEILRRAEVRSLVFLTCRIGNATTFLDQMSRDWAVQILAYKKRIAIGEDTGGQIRVYFHGDAEGRGSSVEAARYSLPPEGTDSYRAVTGRA